MDPGLAIFFGSAATIVAMTAIMYVSTCYLHCLQASLIKEQMKMKGYMCTKCFKTVHPEDK